MSRNPRHLAWNFLKKETPQFDLVVLCPPMVYGPLQHTIGHIAELNESNSRILNLFINSSKNAQLPSDGIHLYVDVRVR
jgi:nucleoside-diphosphate-sugar epimerase